MGIDLQQAEAAIIPIILELQRLSIDWNKSRKRVVDHTLAVPVEFQSKYNTMLDLIDHLGVADGGTPNFGFFERVKKAVPKVSFYPGERDSFGWVTGVMRVNNLEIVFG